MPLAGPLFHTYPLNPHFLNAGEDDTLKETVTVEMPHLFSVDCLLSISSA